MRSTAFYSRKNAATRVALGSTRELLGKIKDFYERKNAPPGREAERRSVQHNGFYTPLFLNFVRPTYDDSLHLRGRQQRASDIDER